MCAAIRILIAEDHPVVAEGYSNLLKATEDFQVVGVASTVQEVYYQLKAQKVDILLLDLILPNLSRTEYSQVVSGYEILDFIREKGIAARAIILSTHEEPSFIVKAQKKGAMGYLSKKADASEIRQAIRKVFHERKEYIQKNLLSRILTVENPNGIVLTQRERSILYDIAEGLTSRQIAEKQHLAHDTIRDYRDNLIRKFGAKNSVNLVKIAGENGYLIEK